jgi:hypothetical protein
MTICIPWLWLEAVQLWFCSKAHECGLLNQTHYNIFLSEIHTYNLNTKVDNFWVWASKLFAKLFTYGTSVA